MNSDIDPATVPFDNDPPIFQPPFNSNTMDSSCEISPAGSAKHPLSKHSHHTQTGNVLYLAKDFYSV